MPHGIDEVEVGQVDGHVEGDAVVADAALDAQAEGADLARASAGRLDPAARMAVAPVRDDAERQAGVDHGALEGAHERPQEQAATGQGHDRIGDELAGPVIGHFAAALDPDHLDAPGRQVGRGRADVGLVGLPAQGQDGRMLEQEERVGDVARDALVDEPFLDRPGLAIADPAQPADIERTGGRRGGRFAPPALS